MRRHGHHGVRVWVWVRVSARVRVRVRRRHYARRVTGAPDIAEAIKSSRRVHACACLDGW